METKEHLEKLFGAYEEAHHHAYMIVQDLIEKMLEKEEVTVRNVYTFYMMPVIRMLLDDWFRLWGEEKDGSYWISGNHYYIISSDNNKIEKKIELEKGEGNDTIEETYDRFFYTRRSNDYIEIPIFMYDQPEFKMHLNTLFPISWDEEGQINRFSQGDKPINWDKIEIEL